MHNVISQHLQGEANLTNVETQTDDRKPFSGLMFHVLKSPRLLSDQIFAPDHESFITVSHYFFRQYMLLFPSIESHYTTTLKFSGRSMHVSYGTCDISEYTRFKILVVGCMPLAIINLDILFVLFQAHGGKIVHSENDLASNTLLIASMDETYNIEKFHELNQPIYYHQTLIKLVYNARFSKIPQLDVTHFFQYALLPEHDSKLENYPKHENVTTINKTMTEGAGTQIQPNEELNAHFLETKTQETTPHQKISGKPPNHKNIAEHAIVTGYSAQPISSDPVSDNATDFMTRKKDTNKEQSRAQTGTMCIMCNVQTTTMCIMVFFVVIKLHISKFTFL